EHVGSSGVMWVRRRSGGGSRVSTPGEAGVEAALVGPLRRAVGVAAFVTVFVFVPVPRPEAVIVAETVIVADAVIVAETVIVAVAPPATGAEPASTTERAATRHPLALVPAQLAGDRLERGAQAVPVLRRHRTRDFRTHALHDAGEALLGGAALVGQPPALVGAHRPAEVF